MVDLTEMRSPVKMRGWRYIRTWGVRGVARVKRIV